MKKNKIQNLIVANWKMHKSNLQAKEWLDEFLSDYIQETCEFDIVISPPFTLIDYLVKRTLSTGISISGQDCSGLEGAEGAYTGDISASMLANMGCKYVILGHSERRKYYQETNEIIKIKLSHAHKANLTAILCVGEALEIRNNKDYKEYVWQNLKECLPLDFNFNNTIIAYEPIWAIGTGKTANIEQIEEMHEFLMQKLLDLLNINTQTFEYFPKIIYGGSVTEDNAADILACGNVNGLLVGGASLSAHKFYKISKSK